MQNVLLLIVSEWLYKTLAPKLPQNARITRLSLMPRPLAEGYNHISRKKVIYGGAFPPSNLGPTDR